ncbi:GNAT family N-acetyltransferase [Oerskovia rustica]|uniref:GNAT family N-acetyltransferase n=1 Tax=Oerskovia rustica TaxID=2762237 RepID=A0ABR8RX18_9CELL|nr:GNAT family N-acetyltransferase [Oerskovia rustica]MBD7952329.1 GNAT family N-acetyltransferase [Oerskovia rustica]
MDFRTATPADVPSLYALWAAAFDAPLMVPVYETDGGRLDRTVVAVLPGPTTAEDRVVASVCWTPRTLVGIPGADGATATLTVGGVANVASAPDMRGRGLVRLALTEAVEQMHAAGMDASLLFTGTPGVYRPSGWETFEVPVTRGPLLPDGAARPERSSATVVARHERPPRTESLVPTTFPAWDTDLPWQDLAALHDAFHAAPLTTRRTVEHWERRIPLWYSAAELLTARRPDGSIVGYLVVELEGEVLRVRELAVGPGDATAPERREALDALALAVRSLARERGATRAEVRLPRVPAAAVLTDALLAPGGRETTSDATGMLRPVRRSTAEIDALRAATSGPTAGFHWPGDYL